MSKCLRLLVRTRTVGERERSRSRAQPLHSKFRHESVSCVCRFGCFMLLPFSLFNRPFLSYTLLPRTLNVSLFVFVVLQNYTTAGNLSRCCTLRAPRVSLSLYCSRCVYCFFIISTIFFFSSMDLFCFGRLLSVTIT